MPTTDKSRLSLSAVTGGVLVNPRARAVAIGGLSAALALMALPAAALTSAPPGQSRMVNAVVVVRPGFHLPLSVPGGHVRAVFSTVGSELVRAPLHSLMAL